MSVPGPRLEAIRDCFAEDQVVNSKATKLSLETLLDTFIAFTEEIKHKKVEQTDHIKKFLAKCWLFPIACESRGSLNLAHSFDSFPCYADDDAVAQITKLRVNVNDFEHIKLLATGAVGKVESEFLPKGTVLSSRVN